MKQYIQKCLYVHTYSKYLSEYIFFISFNIKGTWLQCIICVSIISILQIVWGIATDVYKFYPAQHFIRKLKVFWTEPVHSVALETTEGE